MDDSRKSAIDLDLFRRLLDVGEDEPLSNLMWAARLASRNLPQLLLSVLERDGVRLGSGSSDELARARKRALEYNKIYRSVQEVATARAVKGPSLGQHYPDGLCRPVGDLDLVLSDEQELWQAVRIISESCPVEDSNITVFGPAWRYVLVQLSWAGVDPILDPPFSIDLSTAAFCGNLEGVHARPDLPGNAFIADLLSLAEERFERPFTPKDIIDVVVLSAQDLPPAEEIAAVADELMLAPELTELLVTAAQHADLGRLAEVVPLSRAAAARELDRRAAAAASEPVMYGLLLRKADWRPGLPSAVRHEYAGGKLLLTPMGDYLLTDQEIVTTEQHSGAMSELASLADSSYAVAGER